MRSLSGFLSFVLLGLALSIGLPALMSGHHLPHVLWLLECWLIGAGVSARVVHMLTVFGEDS